MLPTTVVGSYSVPEWLERLKTDYYQRRISGAYLQEIHEVAIKAAIKDQESAGIDIVSDGELRRDNDIDYFLARMPGVEIPQLAKAFYYDYYDAVVRHALPVRRAEPPLGLVEDFELHPRVHRPADQVLLHRPVLAVPPGQERGLPKPADLVHGLRPRAEPRGRRRWPRPAPPCSRSTSRSWPATRTQVDLAVEAINAGVRGRRRADVRAVHVCYGNRYARPLWEGHYDFLFPAMLDADIDQLVLEFARKGYDDLELFEPLRLATVSLGLGVIDVKSRRRRDGGAGRVPDPPGARQVLPPDRLMVNPDCGLRHLPADIARAKLGGMVEASAAVRAELLLDAPAAAAGTTPLGA